MPDATQHGGRANSHSVQLDVEVDSQDEVEHEEQDGQANEPPHPESPCRGQCLGILRQTRGSGNSLQTGSFAIAADGAPSAEETHGRSWPCGRPSRPEPGFRCPTVRRRSRPRSAPKFSHGPMLVAIILMTAILGRSPVAPRRLDCTSTHATKRAVARYQNAAKGTTEDATTTGNRSRPRQSWCWEGRALGKEPGIASSET